MPSKCKNKRKRAFVSINLQQSQDESRSIKSRKQADTRSPRSEQLKTHPDSQSSGTGAALSTHTGHSLNEPLTRSDISSIVQEVMRLLPPAAQENTFQPQVVPIMILVTFRR